MKARIATTFTLLALLATVLVPASPALAQDGFELQRTPDLIWDVSTAAESKHTNGFRALVRDMEEFEGRMYVAGKFLDVVAPDGTTYSRPYLAAFDLETGEWDPSFAPVVDGIVYAIDIQSDGRLYVAGEMPGGAALYDVRTGERSDTFAPAASNTWGPPAVYDIEIVGDDVYLGGNFKRFGDLTVSNLARVDAATGALDRTWMPVADVDTVTPIRAGSLVYALEVDSNLNRVYVVGMFGGINGNDEASYFATLSPSDGSLLTTLPQGLPKGIPNHRDGYSMWMEDVQFDDDRVYVGGNGHQTMVLNASDLTIRTTFYTNNGVGQQVQGGDTQVIHVGEDTVWSGCHCWGSVGPFEIGSYINGADGVMVEAEYEQWVADFATTNPFGQQSVRGGFGFDPDTERLVPLTFDLGGQAGAYAIVEDSNGRLWLGGQFQRVPSSGREISGMVRLSIKAKTHDIPQLRAPAEGTRPADDEIARLYRAVFGRTPDSAGFAYWTSIYRQTSDIRAIASSFVASQEWRNRYGTDLTDERFVDALYQNVLGRSGDVEGQNFWIDGLQSKSASRLAVLLEFVNSPENIARTGTVAPISSAEASVLRLYRAAFGRTPDDAGYSFWVHNYRQGTSITDVANQFIGSAEWMERYGEEPGSADLVRSMYGNVLRRAPDEQGRAYWIDEITRTSRADVLVAFAESPENLALTGTIR